MFKPANLSGFQNAAGRFFVLLAVVYMNYRENFRLN